MVDATPFPRSIRTMSLSPAARVAISRRANMLGADACATIVAEFGLPAWASTSAVLMPLSSAFGITLELDGRRNIARDFMVVTTDLAVARTDKERIRAMQTADALWARFLAGEKLQ